MELISNMYLVNIVHAACWCTVMHFVFINGQVPPVPPGDNNSAEDEAKEESPPDQYTFVALIDVVFTDGSKRTCTGTIIHDYVVITAAHCFIAENSNAQPELTTSFVVIGTKKKFETGYEQYLPIERVITHPKFNGWTADLSLVFTFAGMTSDKPGTVLPLAGERTPTHVESNVTVLSWGHCKDDDLTDIHNAWTNLPKDLTSPYPDTEEKEDEDVSEDKVTKSEPFRAKLVLDSSHENPSAPQKVTAKDIKKKKPTVKNLRNPKYPHKHLPQELQRQQKLRQYQIDLDDYRQRAGQMPSTTKVISRYLTSAEKEELNQGNEHRPHNRTHALHQTNHKTNWMAYIKSDKRSPKLRASQESRQDELSSSSENDQERSYKSYYKNWRRQMGPQQNQLNVEVFGFVNMQTCKKFIDNAMPGTIERTGANGSVCYASDEHYITAEDSGAPAIRHGQLVAVTVGGAECDGDHVAVGMKMSCYCSWIAENLPSGGPSLNCCRNCCDIKHKDEIDKTYKYKNKYLLK